LCAKRALAAIAGAGLFRLGAAPAALRLRIEAARASLDDDMVAAPQTLDLTVAIEACVAAWESCIG